MGDYLIQEGATVTCSHSGQATPSSTNSRVTISGQATVLLTSQWTIAGCPLTPPPLPPCVSAQWLTGTTRVTSAGQPLVIQSGQAVTVPNGTPLIPVVVQARVTAT